MLRYLRPLPKSMRGLACSMCDRTQSSWEVAVPGKETAFACSLCLIYHPEIWNKEVEEAITRIEVAIGHMFERDVNARLVRRKDADDVMGLYVLTSRAVGVVASRHAKTS